MVIATEEGIEVIPAPKLSSEDIERGAYIAAHQIMAADTSAPRLACPGARRSHQVDVIAAIIKNIFELHP